MGLPIAFTGREIIERDIIFLDYLGWRIFHHPLQPFLHFLEFLLHLVQPLPFGEGLVGHCLIGLQRGLALTQAALGLFDAPGDAVGEVVQPLGHARRRTSLGGMRLLEYSRPVWGLFRVSR